MGELKETNKNKQSRKDYQIFLFQYKTDCILASRKCGQW